MRRLARRHSRFGRWGRARATWPWHAVGRPSRFRRGLRLAFPVLGAGAVAGLCAWLWAAGYTATIGEGALGLSAEAGLRLEEIYVEGRRNVPRAELLRATGARRGLPLLGLDLDATKRRLESIPWINDATVERQLPSTLYVRVTERRPYALWQHAGRTALVDSEGVVLTEVGLESFGDLPLVIGPGAARNAAALMALLSADAPLSRRVTAAVWVGDRRWNLRLDGVIEVMLPEVDPARAWARLAELARSDGLLERNLATVDLRLPDRLVLRPAVPLPPRPPRPAGPGAREI